MEISKHLALIQRLRLGISNIEFLEKRILFLQMEFAVDEIDKTVTNPDELLNARELLLKEIAHYTGIKHEYCKLITE